MKAAVKVPELWDNQPIPSWEGRPGNMFGMMDAVTDGICKAGECHCHFGFAGCASLAR